MAETTHMERAEMPAQTGGSGNIFARMVLFVRQVVAEMKKVVYPTRKELNTYFWVVLVFVLLIMAFVGVIDLGFGYLASIIFA